MKERIKSLFRDPRKTLPVVLFSQSEGIGRAYKGREARVVRTFSLVAQKRMAVGSEVARLKQEPRTLTT